VGIDVAEAQRKGQLEVRCWEDAYLRDGHFDQNRMLALIEEVLTGGKVQGFPLTQLWRTWSGRWRTGLGTARVQANQLTTRLKPVASYCGSRV